MKLLMILLSLSNGTYMLLDGFFVILKGKYIGPEKPGPWAFLFEKLHFNVFKLGPLFILFGLLWLLLTYGFITHATWSTAFGMVLCLTTLWYLPFGTLLSILLMALLLWGR